MALFLSLASLILPGIFHLRVPESASVGSAVGRIQAHDPDAGSNAEVEYAIVPGDEGNMFDIFSDGKSQDGVVVLKKVFTHNHMHSSCLQYIWWLAPACYA